MNSNLNAFLRVIREGESSQDDNAYRMLFGGDLISGYAAHPDVVVSANGHRSTAAGAYQFLSKTWKWVSGKLGLKDFSPSSQDAAAIYLIKYRKAYNDVLAGRLEAAILKCNKEWASLPGAPYGQPTLSMDECRKVYEYYGGRYGMQEGQEAPEEVTIEDKESTMNPLFITAAADALSAFIPSIKSVKDQQKVAAVVEVAKAALGAKNEQEVIDQIQTDPAAVNAVKTAVEASWYTITEAGGGGIEGARKAAREASEGSESLLRNPAYLITIALLPLVYGVVIAVMWLDKIPSDLVIMTVTAVVSGVLNGVMGYWLGTSMSSAKKDSMLRK